MFLVIYWAFNLISLTVVVPAFNEGKRLPDTLAGLARFLSDPAFADTEVLIVDDGSTDNTAQIASRIARRDNRFRLLSYAGNRGKGYAVRYGMLKASGEWRLVTDADLSTPLAEFYKLYQAAVDSDAVVAIGSRALNRKLVSRHQSIFREAGGRFFNLIMRLITGLPFADTQCGFKLFRSHAANAIFSRQQLDGFSFDVENMYIGQKLGYRILEVPVAWANAAGTKVTIRSTIRAFTDLWRIRNFDWHGHYDAHLAKAASVVQR